jgi:hypothetical protein
MASAARLGEAGNGGDRRRPDLLRGLGFLFRERNRWRRGKGVPRVRCGGGGVFIRARGRRRGS